ncbi:unnamed protein product [Ambrosiozyma monospora]|uniref:Unnamed protein product n=1 Tax=Ambrosiozyma monospora TaxID=43982 RepID=A0ACB5U8Q7_AMBMO|nr:unnamed protein product [Ambrosiozyma monospora]
MSPFEAGLRLIPSTFTTAMSSMTAGYAIRKTLYAKTPLMWGSIFMICGSTGIWFSTQADPAWRDYIIRIPQTIGSSSTFCVLLISVIAAVDNKDQALATSIQFAFRSAGSTLGASLGSAILEYTLRHYLKQSFSELDNVPDEFKGKLDEIMKAALGNPKYGWDSAPEFCKAAIINSYDGACHSVFLYFIVTAVVTAMFAWSIDNTYVG